MTPGNRRIARPVDASESAPVDSARPAASRDHPRPSRFARVVAAVRTVAGVALVVATSVGVAWVARRHIMHSPRFALARVEISGNLRRAQTILVAESGLQLGTNIFMTDLDAARAKIMSDPWISDATLARRLPETVLVHVTERKAAALTALGDTFLTAPDGEPFKKLDADDPLSEMLDLPLITGLRPEAMTEDREGTMRTIRRAIDLAAEFEQNPLSKRLALQEVHVEADGAFAVVVGRSATELFLGSPPFRRKLDQATRVFAELDKRGAKAERIMLDNDTRPDRVVVRMR